MLRDLFSLAQFQFCLSARFLERQLTNTFSEFVGNGGGSFSLRSASQLCGGPALKKIIAVLTST
jgi:hypothetical protein